MKKYFILLSKIIIITFLFLLAIGICWSLFQKEEEIIVSGYFAIPFLLIAFLTVLVFIIMFICEMIEVVKEKKKVKILRLIIESIVIFILIFIADVFILHNDMNIIIYWCTAISIYMISFALHYWKRKCN